jgi:hypothetical protein
MTVKAGGQKKKATSIEIITSMDSSDFNSSKTSIRRVKISSRRKYFRPGRVWLVTPPAGDRKIANLYLQCNANKYCNPNSSTQIHSERYKTHLMLLYLYLLALLGWRKTVSLFVLFTFSKQEMI